LSLTPTTVLVTGSSGLIGSEVVARFHADGARVVGVDNNQRAIWFGPMGDTRQNQARLEAQFPRFDHHELDIRDRAAVLALVESVRPAVIVHAAAQPSHDRAAQIPFDDFDTNATGTLNLLEASRRFCADSPFIYLSTNKVYGDGPNRIALKEQATRWDYADSAYANGISETFAIDQTLHSLFGASKVAADILVQEYARYFGMATCCLRAGCVTGGNHAGVELHGFLSYLVRCNVERRPYRVYGYGGKQVRDNVHAADVASFCAAFAAAPRPGGPVYNMGGGRGNSVSILEAFDRIAALSGNAMRHEYVDAPRVGDHICYISDLSKLAGHFPEWRPTRNLDAIFEEMYAVRRPA
jgi:CDP-paratose 2-epimerase